MGFDNDKLTNSGAEAYVNVNFPAFHKRDRTVGATAREAGRLGFMTEYVRFHEAEGEVSEWNRHDDGVLVRFTSGEEGRDAVIVEFEGLIGTALDQKETGRRTLHGVNLDNKSGQGRCRMCTRFGLRRRLQMENIPDW